MRFVAGVVLTVAIGLLAARPALAAYCGSATDTKAVEALTIARPPHDRTRIMYLAVVDAFALAELEWKGQLGMYFAERNGRWTYAGTQPPANMPVAVKHRFDAIIDAYPHICTNPQFVSHPSGR
ncbi:MAG TPA: hypothetical protein VGK84_13100 [Candidatus Tumulicola sp.]|jgi:hypothetical protein